jgi:hypothetical protein
MRNYRFIKGLTLSCLLLVSFVTNAQSWVALDGAKEGVGYTMEVLNSDAVRHQARVKVHGYYDYIVKVDNEEYHQISVPDASETHEAGCPQLPVIPLLIAIPEGATYKVSVEEGWYVLGSACGKDGLSVLDICNNSMDDGGNAIIYPWHQAMNQVFYIKPVGDEGYYSIMAMHSGKYLHVKDGSASIVNVHQWSCCDHTNSHWRIYDAGDGFCYIQNRSTGSFLDLNGADITPTNNVGCYDFNKTNAQKWRLNICQVN